MLGQDKYGSLLTEPGVLDVKTLQAWLAWRLQEVVGDADAEITNRANILDDLCAQLGVLVTTGHLIAGAAEPGGIEASRPPSCLGTPLAQPIVNLGCIHESPVKVRMQQRPRLTLILGCWVAGSGEFPRQERQRERAATRVVRADGR
jgi:hypothetical protein